MKKRYIILVLAIILLGITGCSAKENDKNSENDNKEIKEESLALDDVQFRYIYDTLSEYTYKNRRENGYKSFSDMELFEIAIKRLKESDLVFSHEESTIKHYTISKTILINYLKDCFGENIDFDVNKIINSTYETTLNPEEAGSGMEVESYDEKKKQFTVRFGGIGDSLEPELNIKKRSVISATKKGNTITVIEKAFYVEATRDYFTGDITLNIYNSPDKKIALVSEQSYDIMEGKRYSVDDYNDTYTITHRFKRGKNNLYYFVSSTFK